MTVTLERPQRRPAPVRWIWRAAVWATLVVAVMVVGVAVVIPRLGAATPYTVLTGSMVPSYPPGTLVVVKPTDPEQISVGDVVTYQLDSGLPDVVTHRVVGVGTSMSNPGERVFRTQGDANSIPDQEQVREVQIKGRLWYAVPYLGRVNVWSTADRRQVATAIVVGSLLVYALWMFGAGIKDRRRKDGAA